MRVIIPRRSQVGVVLSLLVAVWIELSLAVTLLQQLQFLVNVNVVQVTSFSIPGMIILLHEHVLLLVLGHLNCKALRLPVLANLVRRVTETRMVYLDLPERIVVHRVFTQSLLSIVLLRVTVLLLAVTVLLLHSLEHLGFVPHHLTHPVTVPLLLLWIVLFLVGIVDLALWFEVVFYQLVQRSLLARFHHMAFAH